jgi:hypothetical protein
MIIKTLWLVGLLGTSRYLLCRRHHHCQFIDLDHDVQAIILVPAMAARRGSSCTSGGVAQQKYVAGLGSAASIFKAL